MVKITKTQFINEKTGAEIKNTFGVTKKDFKDIVNKLHSENKEFLTKNPDKAIKSYIKRVQKDHSSAEKELQKMYEQAEAEALKYKLQLAKLQAKAKKIIIPAVKKVEPKKNKKEQKKNLFYTARVIYYTNIGDGRDEAGNKIDIKKYHSHFTVDNDIYVQLYTQILNVTDVDIYRFEHKRTYRHDKDKYEDLWNILRTDDSAPKNANIAGSSSIDCIVVAQVNAPLENNFANLFKPKEKALFSGDSEGGIFHNYINYSLDKKSKTFNEMFKIDVCDYVQDNYKSNSCYVNILVDTFYKSFQNSKHYTFDATYEDFCELLDLDMKVDNIGLTIHKSMDFFKKFNLGLCVIGVYGIIEMYKPEKRNKNLSPDALYILVSNGHCYKLNENMNKFNKQIWESSVIINDEMDKVDVTNTRKTYFIQDTSTFNYDVCYVNNLSEIFEDIKNTSDEENTVKNYIIHNGNLNNIMMDMIHGKPSYIPDVSFENGKIMQLKFKVSNIIGTISVCSTIDSQQKDLVIGPDVYKNYHKARNDLYKSLFTPEHLSTYNPNNMKIEAQYTMKPMTGYFDINTVCNELYTGVDTRKAYTSDFMDIEMYPVYDYFDIWTPYDNHKVEDYNQYLVFCKSTTPEHLILFPETITRVTGYKLNRIDFKDYKILHFKRPSKLVHSNSKELIEKLWSTKISENMSEDSQSKKDIFNIISGLLEKKENKKSLTKIFKNYDEAFYYQTVFGGHIYTIGYDKMGELSNSTVFGGSGEKRQLYLLEKRCKVELVNGFTPIKEMIYDIRSLKNYQTYMKLKSNGVRCVGIKTDSILINWSKNVEKVVKSIFDLSDKIGCYKLEFRKELPGDVIRKVENKFPDISDIEIIDHFVSNERDIVEVNSKIDKVPAMLLLGNLPGVGKTTTACNFICVKKLFVCPYNKLCQSLKKKGINAITLNMLLGIGCNDQLNKKMANYDVTGYDCIVFDEIFLYNTSNLKRIKEFMNNNPKIKIIATGDNCQNAPIGMDNLNVPDKSLYMKKCVTQMFENQIVLQECKRLKNKKDIEKLVKLKADILDVKKDVMKTLRKYGIKIINNLKDVVTKNNICYFNDRCDKINKLVHNTLIKCDSKGIKLKEINYYEGLELICKEHFKNSKVRLFVNYTYVIKKINGKEVTLCEPVSEQTFTLPISIMSKFKLPYANTNHSVQGLTIEEDYTIFDANTPYINRQWVWTSLTRTDDLSKITIFEHDMNEVCQLSVSKRRQYFANKVEGYKSQDRRAGRTWNEIEINPDDEDEKYRPYVDPEWIRDTAEKQQMQCALCPTLFEICLDNGNVTSNVTVDRINNNIAHLKSNCKLTCIKCNCGRR